MSIIARVVVLMALVLSAGGCSFAFVDGPPPASAPATTPANCTVSTFWPNVDLGFAVASGIEAVATYAALPYDTKQESYSRGTAAALYGALFLLSYRQGKREVDACNAWRSGAREGWFVPRHPRSIRETRNE